MSIQVKTRGNAIHTGKQKVFFTSHPDDFEKYSELVMNKVLEKCDCSIWYYPLGEAINYDDLTEMTLFIIPITRLILSTGNYVCIKEYADEKKLPVLPIMMEKNLDGLFRDKFGDREYLSYVDKDETALSFDEKLTKYLDAVVIGDKLAKRIRSAFDAYIFLSYRKKDRKYAQDLTRLIHKNPMFRDVAIWYDEYLTPGENYNTEIEELLTKSDLFALAVTPSLLEKNDKNELNYVAKVEYPMAVKFGKKIVAAEMVNTDAVELNSIYEGLPKVVNGYSEELLSKAILEAFNNIALRENDTDPEHNFLIGLAYLKGIEVEPEAERAVSLITDSAEKGLLEAMDKLIDMYEIGDHVPRDYKEVLEWRKKKYNVCLTDALSALNDVARSYSNLGKYVKALELYKKCYEENVRTHGEKHPNTLESLNNIALSYYALDEYEDALKEFDKCYEAMERTLGETHRDTLMALNNMASCYGALGDTEKELEFQTKCYEARKKFLGEEHHDTLMSLYNIACICDSRGEKDKAFELFKKCYEALERTLGETHPDTLTSLNRLAASYSDRGDIEWAIKLQEECCEKSDGTLGKDHPITLSRKKKLNYLREIYIRCYLYL